MNIPVFTNYDILDIYMYACYYLVTSCYQFLALLAKGQKGLCNGLSPVVRRMLFVSNLQNHLLKYQ